MSAAWTDAGRHILDRAFLTFLVEHQCRMHDAHERVLTGPFKWDGNRITAEATADGTATQIHNGSGDWVAGYPAILPTVLRQGDSVGYVLPPAAS